MMLKKTALIILFIVFSSISFSRIPLKSDSLKKLLSDYEKVQRDDTVVTNLLRKLYLEYQYVNPFLSIEYIDKAQKIFINKDKKNDIAACYTLKGKIYFDQEMYYLAMENYFKSYELIQEQKEYGALAYSLNDIANTYYAQKIYDVPLEYYKRAIEIFKKNKDNFGLSVSYNNIALVKRNTAQLDSALYYLNISLELRKGLNDNFLIAHSYYYIGKIYRLKHDYDKAINYHKQSLELLINAKTRTQDSRILEADSYFEIGNTLADQKQFSEAEKSFLYALVIYQSINNNLMISNTYFEIGKLNAEIKNYKKSSDNLLKALDIALKNKYFHEQRKCFSLLYDISLKDNKKEDAFKYLKQYSELSDSLSNRELTQKLNEVQIAIQTYSKDKENSYLRQKTKDIKRLSFAIILFLCSIILFAVYYTNNKRKNEKRWKQLSNVTFEGVLIHDKNKILDCNNKFLQLVGYERKDIKDITIYNLFNSSDVENIRNKVETEHISEYENLLVRKDKTLFFAEILSRQTTFRGKEARVVAIRDISQRKKIELELKKYMEELKELNVTKDKFFSIIAHDLRNPFLGIIGLTDNLITETTANNFTNANEYLELINASSKRAYELLENLLEWSRTQTGHLKFEPSVISLNAIVKEEIKLFEHIALSKNIKIEFAPANSIYAYADENLIKTVVRNLISNAVKFTLHGLIKIDILEKPDNIEVSIKDSGVGIAEKESAMLFRLEKSQSSPGTSGERGSGLGLILCKEFIEKNNGKIWFESEVGKGSTFFFSLPKPDKA